MRILWLSHLIPYPPKGGVLQRSYNLIRELAEYHEVDLLAFNQRGLIGPLFQSVNAGIAEADHAMGLICNRHRFFEIPSEVGHGGKYWLALRSLFSAPYNINWLQSEDFSQVMREWMHSAHYDVVHFDTISLLPFFDLVPPGIPRVLDHHNIESHMLIRRGQNETNPAKRAYFLHEGRRLQLFEAKYCPAFDLNIVCSDLDGERLQRIAKDARVTTIANGVDLNYFRPDTRDPSPNRLIFAGTMSWYPNIEAVMYIAQSLWTGLRARFPALELDIVGANPPDHIRLLEKSHPGIRVHGFVDDIRPYLENATLYVCPIRDGGGTKLKILDAMAMKKALVSHPIACEGIGAEDGHNVLFAETADEYIAQITRLLSDSRLRATLGTNARHLVEESFGYKAIGKQFAATFTTLRQDSH